MLALLLSLLAACGSNATVSGGTDSAAQAPSAASIPAPVATVPETTAESPVPESAAPATTTTVAALDERLTATPVNVAAQCSETDCVSVAITLAGEVVSFDSATRVITFVDSGRTVTLDPSVAAPWSLVAMGPDDVAYIDVVPLIGADPWDLIAVPTTGARFGMEVARVGGLDPSGDSNLITTAKGVMQVGCCGFDDRSPPAETPLTMAWVTATGEPSGVVLADVHLEYPGDDSTVVVRTAPGGSEQRWAVPTMLAGRDMPPVVATDDGGALLWMFDSVAAESPPILYDFRPDGSIDTFQVGGFLYAAALHSSRFIIVFDDGYVRLELP